MTLPRRIVVGVTYDQAGERALAEALGLAASLPNTELHCVHVLADDDAMARSHADALEAKMRDAFKRLHAFAEPRARSVGVSPRIRLHLRIGDAADALHQTCVDYDADLVVVGTHGRRGLERMVLGSVAEKLVRTAHLPVLVSHPKDFTGMERTPGVEPPRPVTGSDVREPVYTDSTIVNQRAPHISGLL